MNLLAADGGNKNGDGGKLAAVGGNIAGVAGKRKQQHANKKFPPAFRINLWPEGINRVITIVYYTFIPEATPPSAFVRQYGPHPPHTVRTDAGGNTPAYARPEPDCFFRPPLPPAVIPGK